MKIDKELKKTIKSVMDDTEFGFKQRLRDTITSFEEEQADLIAEGKYTPEVAKNNLESLIGNLVAMYLVRKNINELAKDDGRVESTYQVDKSYVNFDQSGRRPEDQIPIVRVMVSKKFDAGYLLDLMTKGNHAEARGYLIRQCNSEGLRDMLFYFDRSLRFKSGLVHDVGGVRLELDNAIVVFECEYGKEHE